MKKEKDATPKRILPVLPVGPVYPNPIITDPQGCYTGKPIEAWETPVQDADDL